MRSGMIDLGCATTDSTRLGSVLIPHELLQLGMRIFSLLSLEEERTDGALFLSLVLRLRWVVASPSLGMITFSRGVHRTTPPPPSEVLLQRS